VSCPACGAPLVPWREALPAEPAGAPPLLLLRCERCGTAVTSGPPPPPGAHDSGAYARSRPRLAGAAQPLLEAFDRRRLRLLHTPPPARLLDIGAGRGRFVAAALRAGYDATGIEPSTRGITAATRDYGVTLERATLDEAAIAPASLDAATLWHVLEHLDDPRAALERVSQWLRPGGVLLVGVPNIASLQAGLGGARSYHLDVPRHRVHFTPIGLELVLRAAGLEPLRTSHVLVEHNPFGMWQSLVSRLTARPSYLYNLLKGNAPARSLDLLISLVCLPLAPLAAVLELAAGLMRRGGTIAVLARRAGERAV
jgi:SAM-dependent methyltransferase